MFWNRYPAFTTRFDDETLLIDILLCTITYLKSEFRYSHTGQPPLLFLFLVNLSSDSPDSSVLTCISLQTCWIFVPVGLCCWRSERVAKNRNRYRKRVHLIPISMELHNSKTSWKIWSFKSSQRLQYDALYSKKGFGPECLSESFDELYRST